MNARVNRKVRLMHDTSLENMRICRDRYLLPMQQGLGRNMDVVDIGALDVNGSYRPLFDDLPATYTGIDMAPGRGVDVVADDPYAYPLTDRCADAVISGQMLEHCEFFWQAFTEMLRMVRSSGFLVLIVPSRGVIHRYPVDCYRFLPDSMPALAKYAGCELVEHWLDESSDWGDLVGVFRKPKR